MNKKSVLWSLVSLLVLTSMLLSACGTPATTAAPATAAPATAAPATLLRRSSGSCGPELRDGSCRAESLPSRPASICPSSSPRSSRSSSRTSPGTSARTSSRISSPRRRSLLASDNPPDLLRLPTMVSFAQGRPPHEPGRLRDGFRLGQMAGATAQPEPD